MSYSYVILRRGARPEKPAEELGRTKLSSVLTEMEDGVQTNVWVESEEAVEGEENEMVLQDPVPLTEFDLEGEVTEKDRQLTPEEMTTHLRLEAYHWPKVIFPPLKRAGHVILDSCTADGKRPYLF